MFYVFHLDVAMTIQVCFKSILHMLQWSDECCRGDETLRQSKGYSRDRAWQMTGARRGWCHGEGRSAAWRGEEHSRLDNNKASLPLPGFDS
jgi:hypothetical protein